MTRHSSSSVFIRGDRCEAYDSSVLLPGSKDRIDDDLIYEQDANKLLAIRPQKYV